MWVKKNITSIVIGLIAVIAINILSNFIYTRIDLTQDQRYTLSEASKQTLDNIDDLLTIDVYLAGDLPAQFKRLQIETKQLLSEYESLNGNVVINYVDPKTIIEDTNQLVAQMSQFGMIASRVDIKNEGRTTQELVFPWAEVIYHKNGKKTGVVVPLLKDNLFTQTTDQRINNSVQHLEYAFANAFKTVSSSKNKKIAYLNGNGQLESIYAYDFLKNTLDRSYQVIPFTLDSVQTRPQETLEQLKKYDLTIIAKPREKFTDEEKYVLDQYMVNGGKGLWLVERTNAEMDSLQANQKTLAFYNDLNLKDLFFQYGFRINPELVKDMYAGDIVLLDENNQPNRYPWFYNPLVIPGKHHEIVNNISPVKFEFTNYIDILKQGIDIKKTPLLFSSDLSATKGVPNQVSLNEIVQTADPKELAKRFTKQRLPLAALLEGKFTSVFKNRVKPFKLANHKDQAKDGKLVVIADGDIIKNQLSKGVPQPLGFDMYTGEHYGNKEFLENAVNYLLDDTGLLKVRNKEVKIPLLNPEKISKEKGKWQLINIAVPLVLLALFGIVYNYFRKKKYS